jgi:hypothetical protein
MAVPATRIDMRKVIERDPNIFVHFGTTLSFEDYAARSRTREERLRAGFPDECWITETTLVKYGGP